MAKLKAVTKDEIDALIDDCGDLGQRIHDIARRAESNFSDPGTRELIATARFAQVVQGLSATAAELTGRALSFMALDEMKRETEAEIRRRATG